MLKNQPPGCFSAKPPSGSPIVQRLIRKTGGIKGKANTAMGRRLLRVLYAMVRDGNPYQAGPSRRRNAAANKARAAKLARKNRKTGKEAA